VESTKSLFFVAVIGALLLFVFFAFIVAISRTLGRKQVGSPPLVASEDGEFKVAEKHLSCSHCGGSAFKAQDILLNTWLLSLLRIDWLDSSATVLTCENCGKLTWFAQNPSNGD
jgi:predicted nucleic-acid-binding Zn-ribbon protein